MTRRNLSVELRPQRLSEMVGQDELVNSIRSKFSDNTVPLGILLTGPFGTGKTTIARILALSFQCTHGTEFGEPCDECVANEDMFSIIERNCAELTTLESVKEFLPVLNVYPNFGRYRVIILDEAQQMSDKAQQALLKAQEDKDSINILIFCTSDPTKINQAVKDRCMPFPIPEIGPKEVGEVVRNTIDLAFQRFGIESQDPEPLIRVLNTAHITSARNIVMATEMYLGGTAPEKCIAVKDAGEVDYYALCKAVSQGDWNLSRSIILNAKPADGSQIKNTLSAYFRSHLLKSPSGPRANLLALFIKELTADYNPELGLQLSGVIGAVYRICQIVEEAKDKKPSIVSRAA